MSSASPISEVFEVTLSTAIERITVKPGQRLVVSSSVAAAIAFGSNDTTPSLTPNVTAAGTLTSDDVFLDTETVTIDGKTYTFRTTLGVLANSVLIGADQTASHLNLQRAINRATTGLGTTHTIATVEHPTVWSSVASGTTTVVRSKRPGVAGNSIATTETCGHAAWGAAVLASGAGEYGQIYLGTAAVAREFIVPSRFTDGVGRSRPVTTLNAIAGGAGTLTVIILG